MPSTATPRSRPSRRSRTPDPDARTGSTDCSTVCSAASMAGINDSHTIIPTVTSTIDDRSPNTEHTAQLARLPASTIRTGFGPSPRRATNSPPAMNARLMTPHSSPHVSTETSSSPYASISAMNTPASRLLNAASRISIISPGTARMASSAPRTSSSGVAAPASTGSGFGLVDRDRGHVRQGDDHERERERSRPSPCRAVR